MGDRVTELSVRVEGLDRLLRKLDGQALLVEPVRTMLQRSAFQVQREAMARTPRVTGTLQRSMTTFVDPAPIPQFARIGTAIEYGPFIEFGYRRRGGRIQFRRAGPARMMRDGFAAARGLIDQYVTEAARQVEQLWHR